MKRRTSAAATRIVTGRQDEGVPELTGIAVLKPPPVPRLDDLGLRLAEPCSEDEDGG